MCGLVGIASNLITKTDMDVFRELLVVSTLRGQHSTGVGVVAYESWKKGGPEVITDYSKKVGHPFNLFDSKHYYNTIEDQPNKRVLIGHTRSATIGSVNAANAHPFLTDNLLGAHNGTIRTALSNQKYYGTDSEALYNLFESIGIERTLPDIHGAWALTWYDHRNESFNIIRNKERTLWGAWSQNADTLYWASEEAMLWLVLSRNGIKFIKPFLFEEDTLYSFSIFKKDWDETLEKKTIKGKEVPVTPVTPFRPATVPTITTADRTTTGTTGSSGGTSTSGNEQAGVEKSAEAAKEGANENGKEEAKPSLTVYENGVAKPFLAQQQPVPVPVAGSVTFDPKSNKWRELGHKRDQIKKDQAVGYRGQLINRDYYKKILQKGCAWCGSDQTGKTFRWFSQAEILCTDCWEHDQIRAYICADDEVLEHISGVVTDIAAIH
jgi:predicted glutamine amidotransferase